MITLYNSHSGAAVGTISEAQLQFLIDNLEEEWAGDTDYYFHQDTLDFLQAQGADAEMIAMLRQAIGESGEAELRWARS